MAHILLIEPDKILAHAYRSALESGGHVVRVCLGAQSAIVQADAVRPDVVILELQLVGHGGIEFLYELRSYVDWQAMPAILLTHVPYAEFADSWSVLHDRLGIEMYLYKPQTSLRQLVTCVHDILAAKQLL